MSEEEEKKTNEQKMEEYINNLLAGKEEKLTPEMNPIVNNEEDIEDEDEEIVEEDENDDIVLGEITSEELENDEEDFDIEVDEDELLGNEEDEDDEDENYKENNEVENIPYTQETEDEGNDVNFNENENNDFYIADENDFFDPQEESLLYSDNNEDSVLFDELNNNDEEEEEEHNKSSGYKSEEKVKYNELNSKKPFIAGKFNKNAGIAVIAGCVLLIIGSLTYLSKKNQKIEEEKANVTEDLNLNGYKPDFGNYKERSYKESKDKSTENLSEQALKNQKAVEDIDKKFGVDNKSQNVQTYQSQSQNYNTSSSNSNTSSNDSYLEKVESSLRFNGQGFGNKNIRDNYNENNYGLYETTPNTNGYENITGYGDFSSQYLDNIGQIAGKINGNEKNKNINAGRYSNAGQYDPTKKGGDINFIPENSIYPGTIIPAILVNGINTDYPGTITGRVISNVYDSKTGKTLLIPSGSIVRGSYSSSSIGIKKIQIAWQTLIINRDGIDYVVNLGSMVGVDKSGYSGIKGTLNDHAFAYLKAAGISSLFTYINANIFEVTQAQKNKTLQDMISGSQDIGNELAEKILDRALDIQPTVTVRPGTRINIDVDKILTLVPYQKDLPKQRYIRK